MVGSGQPTPAAPSRSRAGSTGSGEKGCIEWELQASRHTDVRRPKVRRGGFQACEGGGSLPSSARGTAPKEDLGSYRCVKKAVLRAEAALTSAKTQDLIRF